MNEEANQDNKVWGVVHVGALTFIGAFCDYPLVSDGSEVPKGEEGQKLLAAAIKEVENDMVRGVVLRLEPVMEIMAPLQQVGPKDDPTGKGRAGVAKSPLPMPYGFTTGKTKLRVLPQAVAFINEMTPGDQKLYHSFIDSVVNAEMDERANRAGLTLIKGGHHG